MKKLQQGLIQGQVKLAQWLNQKAEKWGKPRLKGVFLSALALFVLYDLYLIISAIFNL